VTGIKNDDRRILCQMKKNRGNVCAQ
jgi:hypothetical protein